jgi:hypothetical protein
MTSTEVAAKAKNAVKSAYSIHHTISIGGSWLWGCSDWGPATSTLDIRAGAVANIWRE